MEKLIVANWKMNGSVHKLAHDLNEYINNSKVNVSNVVLGLPSVLLSLAQSQLHAHKIKIASQDISKFAGYGAYTGEISGIMLKDVGVQYVIVGHSERREYFMENDEALLAKLNNAIDVGLIPIFCVGESKDLRLQNKYLDFVKNQLMILKKLNDKPNELIIAYEPIWAIGTGLISTINQIQEMSRLIHTFMQENPVCGKITVLYGGSVSPSSVKEILAIDEVNGVLVGGASLKITDFIDICEFI